jgi:NitT/TauT family transport system substrate-binding protein
VLPGCESPRPPMRVGAIVFPGYEFMFLARERNELDPALVNLIELQSSVDTVRALAAGQLEAGALTMDEMMAACADGIDLKAVLIMDSSFGADQVLARPGITLKNLKNKSIAAEDNSVGALVLASLLDAAGLTIDQVRKVPMNQGRALEYYQQGRADVVITAEPWDGQVKSMGAQLLFDSRQMPGLIMDVLAVRSSALDLHARCISHLIERHFEAVKYFRMHTAQASQAMARRLQSTAVQVPAMFDGMYLPDRQENIELLSPHGTLHKAIDRIQTIMLRDKLMRHAIDTSTVTDSRYLRDTRTS